MQLLRQTAPRCHEKSEMGFLSLETGREEGICGGRNVRRIKLHKTTFVRKNFAQKGRSKILREGRAHATGKHASNGVRNIGGEGLQNSTELLKTL